MSKLDERRKKILWAIIQSHIDLNTPIGSFLVTKRFPLSLSPATIRNTMAKLEEMGYITQPHTSAGRVPTEKGYKFYVNTIMEEQTLSVNTALSHELSKRLSIIKNNSSILIKEAAKTLSTYSHYLALATPLRMEDIVLKRVKFIKYEKKKVLAVLISDDGIVKNKIIELDKVHTQNQLDKAANHLNNRFSGLTIKKVREKLAYQLHKEKTFFDELVIDLFTLCKDVIIFENDNFTLNEFAGTSNLPDFATVKQTKEILKAIEDKQFMLKLLNQISDAQGTQVYVGMEDILPAMKELSMVVSTYKNKKRAMGTIGIIGPTRMNYKKLIPVVDHTARAITQILSEI
jgi:heat-inducible transcriptional repressor